jgi:hypothetical protein
LALSITAAPYFVSAIRISLLIVPVGKHTSAAISISWTPIRSATPVRLVSVVEEVLDEWVARVMVHYRWHDPENALYRLSQGAGRQLTFDELKEHPLFHLGPSACRASGTEHPTQQQAAEREYLGGYTGVLAWETECKEGWDGKGELAPFPHSTPFAQYMLALTRDEYIKFVSANAHSLAAGNKVLQIETYGETTTYLAREYPERSRRILKTHAYDTLSEQERSQVLAWLEAEGLTDILIKK